MGVVLVLERRGWPSHSLKIHIFHQWVLDIQSVLLKRFLQVLPMLSHVTYRWFTDDEHTKGCTGSVWFVLKLIGTIIALTNMPDVNAVFLSTNKLILRSSSQWYRQRSAPTFQDFRCAYLRSDIMI